MRFRDYSGTEQFRPLSAWAYFGYGVLFAIPIIGWLFLLIFTFSTKNYNRRSYARSYWCGLFVAVIIIGSFLTIGVGTGWLPERVLALRDWVQEASGRISITASQIERNIQNVGDMATGENPLLSDTSAKQAPVSSIDGVTPEFKETMDKYEAFFDSYIEFMEGYDDGSATIAQSTKYAKMMTQYSETMKALDQIGESTMTEADDRYYIDVMLRINQKLASFAAAQ